LFATDKTGWVPDHSVGVANLLPPSTGERGPVPFERAHQYVPKAAYRPYRVADLSNSILQADHSTDEEGV
jgi:hypothetical protein